MLELDIEEERRRIGEHKAAGMQPIAQRLEIDLRQRARAAQRSAIMPHDELRADPKDIRFHAAISEGKRIVEWPAVPVIVVGVGRKEGGGRAGVCAEHQKQRDDHCARRRRLIQPPTPSRIPN